MRVVVAMSGGVDSSVAAAELVAAGHEVVGLSMQLYDQSDPAKPFGSCCSLTDLYDARRVAQSLGIPHYIVNFEQEFERTVVRNFVGEYAAGRTPIPCVHCNADLKFSHLVDRASGFDASAVATGHYARVDFDEATGRYRLLRSLDREKDQTYFLFSLTQAQLSKALFPVGHMTKPEVRARASELQLAVADKPDSHEICFVPDGDAAGFVTRHLPEPAQPGEIVTADGKRLGEHSGIHQFTVGQRKGLGVVGRSPVYVLKLEPESARVVVGPREALAEREVRASGVNWIAGEPPVGQVRATARIRHRHLDAPGTLVAIDSDHAHFAFHEPQNAVTPGQAVVFYNGEVVIGGGWIQESNGG